ncbi:hypothetical protein OHB26_13190 [Nocardia sp. NBC_01503]|uniref:hypothetical protein n=1 Tax=Nocardia sp. NBC_01503 TaxID=2975997 RepID=UPI002E7C41A3|nr:hypothetical protein [Nocardia sp. NBC_01503]WTL35060.1 hypothetical protein OHB26_13190 [Nocardia sp. NBC_01503]
MTGGAVFEQLSGTDLRAVRATAPGRRAPLGPRSLTAAELDALSANYRRRAAATPQSPGGAR